MESALQNILANSRKQEMLSYLESNPEDFEELVGLAISNNQPYSWRAAWLLGSCMKNNDSRIQKNIPVILKVLDSLDDGHQRCLLNILHRMSISEEHQSQLFDSCVEIWMGIEKQSSVRFRALEFILELCKTYPELYNEVMLLMDDKYLDSLSAGIKKSAIRKLKSLQKSIGTG